jgi:signal transduction histidine kinase
MVNRPTSKVAPREQPTMLHDFIARHRQELIERAQAKVALRPAPRASSKELANGVPLFLKQLSDILKQEAAHSRSDDLAMGTSATLRGKELLEQGFSIAQVVQDYGDICQAITELALDLGIDVPTQDFHTLNRCLDSAIASAVTEYARQRDVEVSAATVRREGFFAHELRNHLNTAMLAFQVVKSGRVGVSGSTIAVLERSLRGLHDLIDRSVSEVRLASGVQNKERLGVAKFIEEMEVVASVEAMNRGLQFSIEHNDDSAFVDVDRHLFASAISNLLQNAFKFTRPGTHVHLKTRSTTDRVSIEVEDQCGGLPQGAAEAIFRPFEQRGTNRAGMGLGLSISRKAIEANGGTLSVRDMPGTGCVFVVDVPRALDARTGARGRMDLTLVP